MTRPKRWSEGVPTNEELVTNFFTKGLFTPYNEGKRKKGYPRNLRVSFTLVCFKECLNPYLNGYFSLPH